jgi:hypothetical protein
MKASLSFCFFILFCQVIFSQEKKIMSNENIKAQIVWVTDKQWFKEIKYKKEELRFDRNGNRVEEVTFDRHGNIVHHKAFEYSKDLVTREIYLDKKGRIIVRSDYRYIGKLLVEKLTYDGKGNTIKNEQFIYEKQD